MRRAAQIVAAALLSALLLGVAWGAPADEARAVELEALRRRVAGQVQLTAYNLLDELVYQWTQEAPFTTPTPVFVAGVTVPVGMGTGLEGLLENHLASLLLSNPSTGITLAACPACTAVVVHSGPAGTVVSRGADNPDTLERLGGLGARHGLYIDLAAEGAWLVLRARITRMTPDLPIVWSRTISSAVGTPSLLRHPKGLKSASAARQEYLDALDGRGPFTVPVRVSLRSYAAGDQGVSPAPVLWLQTGFETALSQARKWKASAVLGYSWLPEAYYGFMFQTRMARLISGSTRSLTGPDVYLFLGGAIMMLEGDAITPLANEAGGTRATFGGIHLGLEIRVGNRVGASIFLENMPTYVDEDEALGSFINNGLVELHSLGAEVSLCF